MWATNARTKQPQSRKSVEAIRMPSTVSPVSLHELAKESRAQQLRVKTYQLVLISFVCGYLLVGTVMCHLLEGWDLTSGIYFMVVSLLAVGYGDLHPTGPASKAFVLCYSLVGMSLVFLAIQSIYDRLVRARIKQIIIDQKRKVLKASAGMKQAVGDSQGAKKLLVAASSWRSSLMNQYSWWTSAVENIPGSMMTLRCRDTLFKTCPVALKVAMFFSLLIVYMCLSAWTLLRWDVLVPEQDFLGCLYFTVITGLTIGYGDVVPKAHGRWFMLIWLPVTFVVFTTLIFKLNEAVLAEDDDNGTDDETDELAQARVGTNLTMDAFLERFATKDEVLESDYLCFMLGGAGIVEQDTLNGIRERFAEIKDFLGDRGTLKTDRLRESVAETRLSTRTSSGGFGGLALEMASSRKSEKNVAEAESSSV